MQEFLEFLGIASLLASLPHQQFAGKWLKFFLQELGTLLLSLRGLLPQVVVPGQIFETLQVMVLDLTVPRSALSLQAAMSRTQPLAAGGQGYAP
jgi:hypothetical protein